MRRVLFFLLLGIGFSSSAETGFVRKVSDGDTFHFVDKATGKELRVRMAYIDAPEKDQDYGMRSKAVLDSLIGGKVVELRLLEIDKYGRSIAEVLLNGESINNLSIAMGNAWHYARYDKDVSRAALETRARREKMGLWSMENPIPPENWRHK